MISKKFLSLALICFSILPSCQKKEKETSRPQKMVKVVAHRGDFRHAPENSLISIQNCIDMGVDMVEIDLHMTKDSVLVLLHDEELERTTTGTGKVSDYNFNELLAFNLKFEDGSISNQHIPTFKEAMTLAKDKIEVFVDKAYGFLPAAVTILQETETLGQAHFMALMDGNQLKSDYPVEASEINYMPLVLPSDTIENYLQTFEGVKTPYYLFSFEEDDTKLLSLATEMSSDAYVMATTQLSKYCGGHTDTVSLTHPDQGWGWVLNQGFNAICTDMPSELIAFLKEKGRHK